MNQRKNAFTLIELLAVIVILAIIALIATPIILNIIEKSKKSAFVDTAYGLIEAAKLQYTQGLLQNTSTPKSYTFPQAGTDKLEFSGGEPSGGIINVSSYGKVALAIHNGTWCVIKSENDSEVIVNKYDEATCILPEEQINYTPEKCFQVEEYKTVTYTIDKDVCINYFESIDAPIEFSTSICIDEEISGMNLADVLTASSVNEDATKEELKKWGIDIIFQNSEGVTITKYNKSDSDCGVDVVIPEMIDGKIVKKIKEKTFIDNWENGDFKKINSVVFPSKLEIIGAHAFAGAPGSDWSLQSVYNQITVLDFSKTKNLRIIGNYAFTENELTTLDLSGLIGLEYIGEKVFECNQLADITFGTINKLKFIGNQAFCNWDKTNYEEASYDNIPSSVIENYGFECTPN